MGQKLTNPRSVLGRHERISCLENKKITLLKPVYLVFFKTNYRNGVNYETIQKGNLRFNFNYGNVRENSETTWTLGSHSDPTTMYNNLTEDIELLLKINTKICFYIKDIVSYTADLNGLSSCEIEPYILNKIKVSDVEIIKAPVEYLLKISEHKYLNLNGLVYMYENMFNKECMYNFISCNEKEENNEQKFKKIIEANKDNYLVEDL
jgi:hypothetical protein